MMFPVDDVKSWFLENKRSFPWRNNPNPYQVWVSEMMLQQTIASVVVSYYERWMTRFPDIATLAKSPFEDVVKMWEGLGYYARARHLHQGARYIMENFGGMLPKNLESLQNIPGIGPYTLGAITSFAHHQRYPAIDGNVTRVIARYLAITEEVEKTAIKKKIFSYVDTILPQEESWILSEALIELGATVCKKQPLCQKCPLLPHCQSYRHGLQEQIPKKKKRPESISLFRLVAVIEHEGSFLLKKETEGKVMGNLYEFPYIEHSQNLEVLEQESISILRQTFEKQCSLTYIKSFKPEKHTFTKYRATLHAFHLQADRKTESTSEVFWIRKDELINLPFSSGHRRILKQVID